ncbi:MAG: 3-deoxy-manno-octulosonate cytidylyltransferase [Bacteroidales bacterium]|nr:3-deoxy-manno-octulosonate cytidylyltransferase [Bacteroidales bacterium]
MKIIGVIPARYQSSRFPGKPLADICGKPMIWWVYQQVCKVSELTEVYVATDDTRIKEVCESYGMNVVMTRNDHPDHIARIQEVSDKIAADLYVCINGDEPLISPQCISQAIPNNINEVFFSGAVRKLTDPVETIDPANIKVVISDTGRCLYISRTPVPFPKGTLLFSYHKYVGIECFSKTALNFFVNTPMGSLEKVEDIDHLRFLEHGKELNFTLVDSESISVDTPKDLEKVRTIIQQKEQR